MAESIPDSGLVSVLIPVYNREAYVGQAIESARAQTYDNLEIVVVDNASDDGTWATIQAQAAEDGRVKAYRQESNVGPIRNWKTCIDKANGVYGKILWSDDLMSPNFIEKTMPFLQDGDVAFAITATGIFEDSPETAERDGVLTRTSGLYSTDAYLKSAILDLTFPVSPGCALFRLADLKNNLLVEFDNKSSADVSMHGIGPDLLLFLLTAARYDKIAYVDDVLSFFRSHAGSITATSDHGKLAIFYNLAKSHFVENHRPDLVRKVNTLIYLSLRRYHGVVKAFGLDSIEKFYMTNSDTRLHYPFLMKKIFQFFMRNIRRRGKG